jgi:addiction module HigA family antidote
MRRMFNPPHPGEVLKDGVFEDGGISVTDAARQLGVSRVQLSRLLNRRAGVSADMAIRLALWLGGSPESWLRMQTDYDLWQSQQHRRPRVKRLKRAA